MSDNKKAYLVVGCVIALFVALFFGIKWALENPQLIVGAVFLVLVVVALWGGGSSPAPRPPQPGDPEQEKRAARRIASESADAIIKAHEAGEITLDRRDELLKHIYHAPTDGPPRPGPGRRP